MIYRGIVEDSASPNKDGRVKVRLFGIHGEDVPTSELPWAEVMQSIDFIGEGKGKNTIIDSGTWVICILDHDNPNMPIVIGTVAAHNDINTKSNEKNQVVETTSGHLIEIDDNSGNERIHVKHKSGSYAIFKPNGDIEIFSTGNIKETASNIFLN